MAVTVTGLNPASAPEGTLVVITGTDFTEDTSRVRFGTYECGLNYSVISDTEISCVVPVGTGAVYVYVTTPAGTNVAGAQFTFATYEGGSNSAPTIISVTPLETAGFDGAGGDSVVIAGTYLTMTRAVFFGPTLATAVQAAFTVNSAIQVTAIAPPGEPGVQTYVFVETNYGTVSTTTTANDFLYKSSALPTVTSLTPATALPDFEVTVTGTNYTYATAVRVGTLYAAFTFVDATTIKFIVPGGTTFLGTTAEVYVSNFWGESTTHATLTYATAGTLRTTLSLNTGTPAMSPRDGWIVTGSAVTCTLVATYTPWSLETYVESKWYRRDNDAPVRYTGTFTVSGEGSHKIEFWSVGKDGVIEATNVRYVNIVATATPTLTATAGISQISFSWTAINIPGVYYVLYYGAANPPSTNPTTLNGCAFTYLIAPGTNVYARVRVYGPDGTDYGYSNVTGPTQSSGIQATDLADNMITAAKLAPSITPPPIFASDPAVGGYVNGDYYYNSTDHQLHILSGGAWTHASAQDLAVIGKVVAGVIEAGAIGATEIAADTIFAKHLVVADYENLVQNGSSELALPSGLSYPVAYDSVEIEFRGVINTNANRGNNCRRVTGNTTAVYLTLCDPVPAKAGDVFRISVKSKVGTTGTAQVAIAGVNASGSDVATPTASTGTTSTSYQSDGPPIVTDYVEYTVPTGSGASAVVAVRAYLMYTGAAATYGYFDDILFRKMLAGSLVVDGAITAAKIEANTITGNQIHANVALDAPVITGGIITGTTINARTDLRVGDASNSGTITLDGPGGVGGQGLFRSHDSGDRIEIYSAAAGYLDFQTDNANEVNRARFYIQDGTSYIRNQWVGPRWNNSVLDDPSASYIEQYVQDAVQKITLKTNHTDNTTAEIELSGQDKHVAIAANGATLEVGESANTAKLTGDFFVTRGIIPNYAGAICRETDCMGPTTALAASTGAEWGGETFGTGGAINSEQGSSSHPGIAGLHTGSAANGGVSLRTAIDALTMAVGDWAEFIICYNYLGTAIRTRAGFTNQFSSTTPTIGAFFATSNASLTANACFQTAGLVSSSAYTVNNTSWYRLRVYIYSNTHVYFWIYRDGSATAETNWNPLDLYSGTYALATGAVGHGAATYTTSTVQQDSLYLDYMSMYLVPRSR